MNRDRAGTKSPTIREVALRAGVSVAAASYALNNSGRISADTKAAVLRAAEELQYSPSLAARVLKGVSGNLVAILTDGLAGPWYGEVLEGIQPCLTDAGQPVLAMSMEAPSLQLCRHLVDSGWIRALIVLNPGPSNSAALAPLAQSVPMAVFDADASYSQAVRFVLDNRTGITHLMEHLWSRGYRDFLWLDGDTDSAWDARERSAAFLEFCEARGVPPEARRRVCGGFKSERAYLAVTETLRSGPIPRAIVAANDESAIGALRAVRQRGLNVPADIAIAGFDGIDGSAWTEPPLTTLSFDRRALGHEMAQAVLDALSSKDPLSETRQVALQLLVRAST